MLKTSIGSLPFTDVRQAVDTVLEYCPEIPFWPQMPQRSFSENFYWQSLEGVPAVTVNVAEETVHVDTRKTDSIERFYEDFATGRTDSYALSEESAPGFFSLLERIKEIEGRVRYIKVQLTGPFTMGLGLKDENGKSIIYDAAFYDVIKKGLNMKARWLVKTVKKHYPGKSLILFFDEPAMISFGSAFVNVTREEVISSIDEVIDGVDAAVGIHCCGNTDWPVLFNSRIDLINYDASAFLETIFYYPTDLTAFLSRGGRIVPGIVPTLPEAIDKADSQSVKSQWEKFRNCMAETGCSRNLEETIVTTACGLGSIDEEHTRRSLDLLRGL